MIYVSSSCIKANYIHQSVESLVSFGFKNIELSGGTQYYDGLMKDLLILQKKHQLNFLCHNYFPPPEKDFILNLASLDDKIYENSISHIQQGIEYSESFGANRFGFHAGYFIDFSLSEIGKEINKQKIVDKNKSIKRFCDAFGYLESTAGNVVLYIENNVCSQSNYISFDKNIPFMLTNYEDYLELKKHINFNFLLDIAHLKVSCNVLGLSISQQLTNLISHSDYIHLSDNDGLVDQNKSLTKNSEFLTLLKNVDLSEYTITLETYEDLEKIRESYEIIEEDVYGR